VFTNSARQYSGLNLNKLQVRLRQPVVLTGPRNYLKGR